MKNLISLLILLISILCNVNAARYYVSPTGNDNNNGLSPATPFKTLGKINSLSFQPGDKISLKSGAVFNGHLVIDENGTMSNPIVLNSYGDGGRPTIKCFTKAKAVTIRGSHFVVKDLKIIGVYVASTDGSRNDVITNAGLVVDAGNKNINNITIDNVEVSKFEWFGIKVNVGHDFTINDLDILNSTAHNNGYVGIMTKGTQNSGKYNIKNVLVDGCLTYNNKGWADSAAGSGIHLKNVLKGIIQRCEAHHNGGNNNIVGRGGGGGIWSSDSKNVIIQYNESHHNETGNADGIGFNFDGGSKNGIMQYNYSHDNDGGGLISFHYGDLVTENITIRYNISENDGLKLKQGAIHLQLNPNTSHHMKDIYIYNNTVYNDNPEIEMVEIHDVNQNGSAYDIRNVHVYNNLFVQPNGGDVFDYVGGGEAIDDNNFRDPIDGNARLNNPGNSWNGYKIGSNSPLINQGLDLNAENIPGFTNVGYLDVYGDALPQNGAYDIGADEFKGEINNPNPHIEVTAPTEGEVLALGAAYNIQWEHNISGTVKIILFKGGQYHQTLINSTANDGHYSWNVGTGLSSGDNYQIRVRSNNNPEIDDFTNLFSIANEGQSLCNLIPNGNFNNGNVSGWSWIQQGGALGTFDVPWNKALLNIDNPGTSFWQLRLEHENIYLEGGKTYQLRYDAKAWGNRDISLRIVRKDNYNVLYENIISLEDAWNPGPVATFTMPADGNIGILFRVGSNNKTVVLDNITLNEISCPTPNNIDTEIGFDYPTDDISSNTVEELMVSIFPNPVAANHPVHLALPRSSFNAGSSISIIITDINGRRVLEREYDVETQQITLNHHLIAGVYVVAVINGNQVTTEKLVIQ